jgi:hypothetical protein
VLDLKRPIREADIGAALVQHPASPWRWGLMGNDKMEIMRWNPRGSRQ